MSNDAPKKTWKLTAEDITSIVDLAENHKLTTAQIAARKNVSAVSIWRVLDRKGGILKKRRRVDADLYLNLDLAVGIFLARTSVPKISWRELAGKLRLPMSALRLLSANGKALWIAVEADEREAQKQRSRLALERATVSDGE